MSSKITFKNATYNNVPLSSLCDCKNSPLLMPDAKPYGDYLLFNANNEVGRCDFGESEPYISIIKYGSGISKVKLRPAFSNVIGTMGIINEKADTDLYFLYYLLQTLDYEKYIEIGTAPNMYFEDFGEILCNVPHKKVQERISLLLTSLDKLIEDEKKELNKNATFKKTMLFKMFARNGVNSPSVRFKGFVKDWTKCSLSDCASYLNGFKVMPKSKFISTENMLQSFKGIKKYSDQKPVRGILFRNNDILMSNIRPYLRKIWLSDDSGICSTDVLALRVFENIDPQFLYYCLANDNFIDYVMSASKGTKMPRGDKQHILEYIIYIPEIDEQIKIASFIRNLDQIIENQEKEVELLSNLKNCILNKLF